MSIIDELCYGLNARFPPRLPKPTERELESIRKLREAVHLVEVNSTAATPSEGFWLHNSNRLAQLIHHDDPRRFLRWEVITSTMFAGFQPYLARELAYLKDLDDWGSRWKPAVCETPFGLPIPFSSYPQSSGNLLHHAYHLARLEQACRLSIADLQFVVEFGGGYGSLCRLFYNLGFTGEYAILDLPVFSALQRFFLESIGIPVREKNSDPEGASGSKRVHCLSDVDELAALLLSRKAGRRSAFIATWSLSESPVAARDPIVRHLSSFEYILVAYQKQFCETDNAEYFSRLSVALDRHDWQQWEIPHLLGNFYLIGCAKPAR